MVRSRSLAVWAAAVSQGALAQNIIEPGNWTEPCDAEPCFNGATCRNLEEDGTFECGCTWGYSGDLCEEATWWTLQQWQSNECGGAPWRCFRLRMGECVDTGFTDGNFPNRKNWFGRLTHVNENGGIYTLDLCWGEGEEGEGEPGWDPEEKCNCEYHWTNIRRLGKNSLGPPTGGDTQRDSDECHKLQRITSSKLVNSTGIMTGDREHTLCEDPNSAAARASPALAAALALVLALRLR